MTATLLVRRVEIPADNCEWWLSDVSQTPQHGTWSDLALAAQNADVILLLPATDVLLTTIDLPVKSNSQLKKALPYALEELLANEVENYHLVWHTQKNHKIAVAAIEHEKLAAYLQPFHEAGIHLTAVYSEVMLLPCQEGSCSVLVENNQAIVRFANYRGGGMELDYLPLLLEKTIAEDNVPTTVALWTTGSRADLPRWSTALEVNCETIPSALSWLQAHFNKKTELNLLTGTYSPQQHSGNAWQLWLPAVVMTLLAVLIQYGVALTDYWRDTEQLATLETQNQQLFKQTFPELKRIVNIKTQAEQALMTLQKQNVGASDSSFLHLLYASAEILRQDPTLKLQTMDFTTGILNIQLMATDIAQIETFKQLMQKNNSLSVNIQSAESTDKGLSVRLEISGKTS